MYFIYFALLTHLFFAHKCLAACESKETHVCSTGGEAIACFRGCNCNSGALSCSEGYPSCLGNLIIDATLTGPQVSSINAQALNTACLEGVTGITIQGFNELSLIEPGVFQPVSGQVIEIDIRNNTKLETIDEGLFQGIFPNLRILAIEYHPLLSDITFLKKADVSGITQLLLAYNNISTLPCGLFDNLLSLKRVDLQGNLLVTFDECMLGLLIRLNNHLELNVRDNPLNCNCSMLPLFELVAYIDIPLDTMCRTPVPFVSLADTMKLLSNPTETSVGVFGTCPGNVSEAIEYARIASRCPCTKKNITEKCKPDCVLWKEEKRPPCNNVTDHGWITKIEGCLCKYAVMPLEVKFDRNWGKEYCSERGALTHHLETMSGQIWLSVAAVFIVLGVIPFIINAKKCYNERKKEEDDGDAGSVDEEFVDYLLFGGDSKWKRGSSKKGSTVASKTVNSPKTKSTISHNSVSKYVNNPKPLLKGPNSQSFTLRDINNHDNTTTNEQVADIGQPESQPITGREIDIILDSQPISDQQVSVIGEQDKGQVHIGQHDSQSNMVQHVPIVNDSDTQQNSVGRSFSEPKVLRDSDENQLHISSSMSQHSQLNRPVTPTHTKTSNDKDIHLVLSYSSIDKKSSPMEIQPHNSTAFQSFEDISESANEMLTAANASFQTVEEGSFNQAKQYDPKYLSVTGEDAEFTNSPTNTM